MEIYQFNELLFQNVHDHISATNSTNSTSVTSTIYEDDNDEQDDDNSDDENTSLHTDTTATVTSIQLLQNTTSLPIGIYTELTHCYSPSCNNNLYPCYSYTCPKREKLVFITN